MVILNDGFATLITFASGTIEIYEKSVTPPGIEAGGEIDTTTMHNTTYRTKQPKSLKTLSESSFTAAYEVAAYTSILAQIGVNQLITIEFPDGTTYAFWGWLDSFVPGELTEGEQPEAEVTIIASNQNASGAETAPVVA